MHINLIFSMVAITLSINVAFAAPADLPKTGQTTSYDTGTIDDGALQTGVAWPSPRFTNPDGTTPITGGVIRDRLTGLTWTADGKTPGPVACNPGTYKNWQNALVYVACLNANSYQGYTDWRLPNVNELDSLVNAEQAGSAAWLNTQGFVNVQGYPYWTSTSSNADGKDFAWLVDLSNDRVYPANKINETYILSVRGGQ